MGIYVVLYKEYFLNEFDEKNNLRIFDFYVCHFNNGTQFIYCAL